MTELERSHAELGAAVLLAGKEIRKLNFAMKSHEARLFFGGDMNPDTGASESA